MAIHRITVEMSPEEYDAYRDFIKVTSYESPTPHPSHLPDSWLKRYAAVQGSDHNYVAASEER